MPTEARAVPSSILPDTLPRPRRVPFDAPWNWLAAGWRDVWSVPGISLAYGTVFAIGAGLMMAGLASLEASSLFMALAGGFLLVGPCLAVGLYHASRQIAAGQPITLRDTLTAWAGSAGQLGFFGAILLFVYLVWMQLAFLLLMLFLGGAGFPPPSAFMHSLLFTPSGLGLLVVGTIAGGLLASFVFAISAVSVPILLVHRTDAITAARSSIDAILQNPKPMALWAGLIVVIMGAGFATLLIGLAIAFPLIGHATWHAYVDIYGDLSEGQPRRS